MSVALPTRWRRSVGSTATDGPYCCTVLGDETGTSPPSGGEGGDAGSRRVARPASGSRMSARSWPAFFVEALLALPPDFTPPPAVDPAAPDCGGACATRQSPSRIAVDDISMASPSVPG